MEKWKKRTLRKYGHRRLSNKQKLLIEQNVDDLSRAHTSHDLVGENSLYSTFGSEARGCAYESQIPIHYY